MIEIRSVEQIEVLEREGGKESGYLKLRIKSIEGVEEETVLAPIIFERYEQWESGLKTDSNRIGGHSPDCLPAPPLPRGIHLCRCRRHLLHLGDYSPAEEVEIYLRQVVVLPNE